MVITNWKYRSNYLDCPQMERYFIRTRHTNWSTPFNKSEKKIDNELDDRLG